MVGGLMRLWAQALYRPPGSYAIMPASALVVFAAGTLLVIAVLVGLILVARPSSQRSGEAVLIAAGASVAAFVVIGAITGGRIAG